MRKRNYQVLQEIIYSVPRGHQFNKDFSTQCTGTTIVKVSKFTCSSLCIERLVRIHGGSLGELLLIQMNFTQINYM